MDTRALAEKPNVTDDDLVDAITYGATYTSSYFKATEAYVKVRGGGSGANAFVARITGTHPDFHFEREFTDVERNLSRSGASGSSSFAYEGDGLYEYRHATETDRGWGKSGFFLVLGSKVVDLGNKRATIRKALAALEQEQEQAVASA